MKKRIMMLLLAAMLAVTSVPLSVQAAPASGEEGGFDDEGYSATGNPRKKPKPQAEPKAAPQVEPQTYVPEVLHPADRESYPAAAEVLDSVGWDLRAAYNWSVGTLKYYGHGKPDMPEDQSPGSRWFADFGFQNLKGNCFVYAATFYEMARLLGYPGRQMYGWVPKNGGGITPHSWVELDINGVTWVFDPEFHHATGRNGFQFSYGTPGTWYYVDYVPMSE